MTRRVLFLCPHGAAKSVLAAVYCQQLARERGLELAVNFAGTEPDTAVAPAVAQLLQKEGFDVTHFVPHRVTVPELIEADWIISLGCDVDKLPEAHEVIQWHDVPLPSQNLLTARDMILARVKALVNGMSREDGRLG